MYITFFLFIGIFGTIALLTVTPMCLTYFFQSGRRKRKGDANPLAAYADAPIWERSWDVGLVHVALVICLALPFLIYEWSRAPVLESEVLQGLYLVSLIVFGLNAGKITNLLVGRRVARRGREYWLAINPGQKQSDPLAEFLAVFSVLVDWSDDGIELTVTALADGTASLYTNRGFSFVSHLPAEDDAAKQLVRRAEQTLQASTAATSSTAQPFPPAGVVRIHIRTYDGLRVIEGERHDLESGNSELSGLFRAADGLLVRLIETARGGRGLEPYTHGV